MKWRTGFKERGSEDKEELLFIFTQPHKTMNLNTNERGVYHMRSWNELDQGIDSISEDRKLEIDLAAYLVEQIVARRNQLSLTQAELGEKVKMSQSQIARVENHATVPRLNTLIALADALGLEVTLSEKEQAASL